MGDWCDYFSEFGPPDQPTKEEYETILDQCLSNSTNKLGFVVSRSMLSACILKVKKKKYRGIDQICGNHLQAGSSLLLKHLTLLFQTTFFFGISSRFIFCPYNYPGH